MQCPCFNCKDRRLGCFGECDRYKAFWVYRQQFNAERQKAIRAENDVSAAMRKVKK